MVTSPDWQLNLDVSLHTAQGAIDIGELIVSHGLDTHTVVDALGNGAEAAMVAGHVTEALLTGGISLALTGAVMLGTKFVNSPLERKLKALQPISQPVETLHFQLRSGTALPRAIQQQLKIVPSVVTELGAA